MKRLVLSITLCLAALVSRAAVWDITAYGAAPDGATLATAPIQRAIDDCHAAGGGVVLVPRGTYLTGTLNLRSNVEFRMQTGAVLRATLDLAQYQRHNRELAGIFYTEQAHNVSITGNGLIDGRGMEFMEPGRAKTIGDGQRLRTRQGLDFRKVAEGLGDGPLYPKERYHQMIVFSQCTDVSLEDFKCVDSPYWCLLVVHCDGVKMRGLRIDNNLLIPNSDGADVISSSNVNISDCFFKCGDDALVLAGYGEHHGDPGFRDIRKPSSNINVSNCIFQSRSSGIRIGGHDQNPMSNYNFSNITIFDSNRGINISVSDSCSLENMNFTNIRIETRLHTGDWWGHGEPIHMTAMVLVPEKQHLGVIRNIFFNNITCVGENSVVMIADEQTQIRNVCFTNFEFKLRRSALEAVAGGNYDLRLNVDPARELYAADVPAFYIENAENVFFNQGSIVWDGADRPYHTYAVDALKVRNLRLENMTASASPAHPNMPAVRTRECRQVVNRIGK